MGFFVTVQGTDPLPIALLFPEWEGKAFGEITDTARRWQSANAASRAAAAAGPYFNTMQTIRLPPFLQRCYTTLFYFISSLIGESCVHFGSIPLSGLINVPLSYLVHASTIRIPFISYLLVDFISLGADSGVIEPRYTHIFSLCLPLSRLFDTRYVEISVTHTWLPCTEGSHGTVHIDLWTVHSGQSQLLFLSPISRHHFLA